MKFKNGYSVFLSMVTLGILAYAILNTILPAQAQQSTIATDTEPNRAKIEKIIREFLLKNPELLVEMSALLEERQQKQKNELFISNLSSIRDKLTDSNSPVLGNPESNNVIVEFSDYNCPYCRRMGPIVKEALQENKDLKVILREFPVLGEDSLTASKAALASKYQNKYEEFHFSLINNEGRINEKVVFKIANKIGLDIQKLKKDMQRPEITAAIQQNMEMAQRLGINGTPAFIAGNKLVPGAIPKNQFSELISVAKEK